VATTQGVDPFLKATLPTRVLRRHRLSLHRRALGSSPYDTGLGPTRHASWPGTEEAEPPRAERVTAPQLQALLHPRLNQRVKGRTAMQVACNCTTGMHPFDFDASSVEAQAHTSYNRRAGYYVRKTAPPLAPLPRLLDCGTGAATRGNPAHGPTVPTKHIGHGSVSRGRRRDGRNGQKWAGSNGGSRRAEAAVKSSAGSRPLLEQQGALSHGVKTTHPCSVPQTARARTTAAPRTTRPVALPPRQGRRHLWQAKRATFHLRHDDRVKKGAPHRLILYPFPLPLSLSCYRDRKGDISKGILLREGSRP
jgi:hypothetical protein